MSAPALTLEPISVSEVTPVERPKSLGPAPVLQWVQIDSLVVDPTYQRPMGRANITAVRHIAANFNWTMFSAVVVAPIEGGRYAIIDGQHRCRAAKLIGLKEVPVQLVIADQQAQAAAFAAINGQQTLVHPLNRHRAETAAGDPGAVALNDACAVAGVTIAPYPKAASILKPGETVSVNLLRKALAQYGRETFITALQCITETSNNYPGAVSACVVRALCEVLHTAPRWRDAGEKLLKVFDDHDLATIGEGLPNRKYHLIDWARATLRAELGDPILQPLKLVKSRAA